MMKTERFYVGDVAEDDGTLGGTVVVYGDTARDKRRVRFAPGAFGKMDDVTLNVMHDGNRLLARTGGGGMELDDCTERLTMSATLPDTTEARDALALIRGGVLRGLSLECRVIRERRGAGGVRIVERAALTGIAVVDRPAMPQSTIAARVDDPAAVEWWQI